MSVYEYTTHLTFQHVGNDHLLNSVGFATLLQEAASCHADSLGFGVNHIDQTNLTWLLLYWKIKIFSRPSWNTKVIVKTWAREIARIHSYRDFEVYDEAGNLIGIATSKWVLIQVSTHSIARITPEIVNRYGIVAKSVFPTFTEPKVKEQDPSMLTFSYTVSRRDIDRNHHVNNLYYFDFALEALPEDIYTTNFSNIEIFYKKEIKLGSLIQCFYANTEEGHMVTIKSEDLSTLHAIIRLN